MEKKPENPVFSDCVDCQEPFCFYCYGKPDLKDKRPSSGDNTSLRQPMVFSNFERTLRKIWGVPPP